jgi:hypothetical protein
MTANHKKKVTAPSYRHFFTQLMVRNAYLIDNSTFVLTDQVKIKSNTNTSLLIITKLRYEEEGKYNVIWIEWEYSKVIFASFFTGNWRKK